jgi:hypothetical protein
MPHVRRLCAERGWTVSRAEVVEHVLEVDVRVPADRPGERQEAGWALIGTFAEQSSHVVSRGTAAETRLEVTTGVLEGDSHFAPHGHVVRLRVTESSGTGAETSR